MLSEGLRCGLCRRHWHRSCLPAEQTTQGLAIPWHCSGCRANLQRNGVADVTLDTPLLKYLATGKPPPVAEAAQRVIKTARWLRLDSAGRLWATHDVLGWQRRIPPLGERLAILREASRNMGSPGGDRLYEHVRLRYYWRSMRADCMVVAQRSKVRQKELARFLEPPYLHVTERGAAPFRIWAIDTIVKLTPAAPDGSQNILVAIDPFTRWVEIGRIPHLNSHEAIVWFHENITCRYGLPYMVRSDRGTEF